jgi:AraC-like DNA-binding protein
MYAAGKETLMQTGTERIEFTRPHGFPAIETVRVEHSHRLWRAFHETYNVCALIDSAGVDWRRGRELSSARTGDVLFAEPGDLTLSTRLAKPQTFVALSISAPLMQQASEELDLGGKKPHWRASQITNPLLFGRLVQHHRSLVNAGCALEAEHVLADYLPLLFEHCFERRARPIGKRVRSYVLEARDFIHENFAHRFGMDDLSRAVRTSRYHLSRAFRSVFGVSPHEYLVHVRLAKARELLKAGVPIQLAAAQTGFSDQSHLTRRFHAALAITPNHYACAHRTARKSQSPILV